MIEELVVGGALMAVSALTFIAYRHPRIYQALLFDKLYLGTLVVFLLLGAWNISHGVTLAAVEKFIPAADLDKAEAAAEQYAVSFYVAFFSLLGAAAYLLLLSWLARHFEKEHRRELDDA